MMKKGVNKMNSKERVIAALNFEKTDRIPRYEIFLPGFIEKWKMKKKLSNDVLIHDYYKKVDIGDVLADQNGPFFLSRKIEKREGNTYYERDSWGRLTLKKDNAFFEQELEVIIDEKEKLDSITFESPLLEERYVEIENACGYVHKHFAPVSGVLGLYMGSQRMRGQIQYLIDMAEDISFCKYLAHKLMDFTKEVGLKVAELTDTKDTALWVYDEFSSRLSPMFSPDTFSKVFLPYYKEMISFWKSKGIKNVILHCDGNSLPLLDMIIEAGFTGLQSLAPTSGMWLPDVKNKYGRQLVLIGGMCNMVTLAKCSFKDIEKEARSIVEVAKDGGVIIGTHSIDLDVPVENYDYYYSILNECDESW